MCNRLEGARCEQLRQLSPLSAKMVCIKLSFRFMKMARLSWKSFSWELYAIPPQNVHNFHESAGSAYMKINIFMTVHIIPSRKYIFASGFSHLRKNKHFHEGFSLLSRKWRSSQNLRFVVVHPHNNTQFGLGSLRAFLQMPTILKMYCMHSFLSEPAKSQQWLDSSRSLAWCPLCLETNITG